MFRAILYLIGILLATSVVRAVLSIITKAANGGFNPATSPTTRPSATTTAIGELKKDPVCGTFISTATAFQKAISGETFYFCSTQCRDRYKG